MPVSSTVTYFWILTCRKCDLWAWIWVKTTSQLQLVGLDFRLVHSFIGIVFSAEAFSIRIYSMNRALIASDSSLTPSLKNCFFSTEQLYLIVLHFLYKPRCLVYQTTTLDPVHHITCLIKKFIHPSFWIFRFWLFRYSPK